MSETLKQWLDSRVLTMEAVTEEFPAEMKPEHAGVYWVEYTNGAGESDDGWCVWDGRRWAIACYTIEAALRWCTAGVYQNKRWRGLRHEAQPQA
jgi:hypothetical protein